MRLARANLDWRAYAAVFVITAAITALYHLLDSGVKVALLFDGRHYFESCQRVTALILAMASMKPDAVVAAEHALREYIMLDGPVLPTLFGTVYALLGRVPTSSDWTVLVWVQTVLHAIATVLVCKITFQMTRKAMVAVICSALWAVYPSALIASGRLMTESLAIVLLLSLPLALRGAIGSKDKEPGSADDANAKPLSVLQKLSHLVEGNQYGLVAGLVSGLLILLKPGMIPSVVLCWLACLIMTRTRLAVALSLLIGAGLAVSPWMLYTKQTTGKAAITVQRMPVHNALIGWDPETSGWQTNPPSGFERVLNTGGEPLSTIEGIWLNNPSACLPILSEKFGHLYSTPWNDYRAKVFGLNTHVQGIYHYFLLFAALAGFFAWMLTTERKNRLAILCIAAAGGQCVYLMFEPVCRYTFPQFAFAPVLFSLMLTMLIKRSRNWKVVAIAALLSAGCVELVAQSESASAKRLQEVAHNLKGDDKLSATISIAPETFKNADVAMLLVDGDANLESSKVEVNGRTCDGKLLAFNYYDPQRYQAFNLLKELGYGLNATVDDFRIWRAIPIPVDAIKDGSIKITITPDRAGCTVYGDTKGARNYLSPDFLCVNRLINSKSSMEMRNESPILAGRSERSWSIQSSGGVAALSDNPRIRLLIGRSTRPVTADASSDSASPKASSDSATHTASSDSASPTASSDSAGSTAAIVAEYTPKDFDENMRTPTGELKISKSILKAARTTGLTQSIPTIKNSSNLSITLEGEMRAASKAGDLGIVIETITVNHNECFLARLPSSLPTTTSWTHFKLTDVAPRSTRQGAVNAVSIAFFPGPWQQIAGYGTDRKCTDTFLRNLKLTVKASAVPSLEGKQLQIF